MTRKILFFVCFGVYVCVCKGICSQIAYSYEVILYFRSIVRLRVSNTVMLLLNQMLYSYDCSCCMLETCTGHYDSIHCFFSKVTVFDTYFFVASFHEIYGI